MAPGATTSTRWCPTPEQLMILEEMYRGGVRTPNATQIQHITAHLSLYGKIEGKNVFYWFQNHKARDRQKLRRRLAKHLLLQHHQHHLLYHGHDQFFDHLHHHHHLPSPVDDPFFPSIHPSTLPPSGFHPVSPLDHYYPPSPTFVPPQGDVSCEYAMNLSWKMEMNPARGNVRDEDPATRAHGDDWVVISSNLNSRPLKTLELFPVTSSIDESPSLAC